MLRLSSLSGPAMALAVILLVAGCGQKGPLYLPDEAGQQDSERDDEERANFRQAN